MAIPRLPRFQRSIKVEPFQLTERDRKIIRLVYRHRFLRSSHISSVLFGSDQQVLRRLKLLYHHRYLSRPRAQIDYYRSGGSREIVYGLGAKGASLLRGELGELFREKPWDEDDGFVKRIFLEHALLVSNIMVSIELACRQNGVRLVTEQDFTASSRPFRWKVDVAGKALSVAPDRLFALESVGKDGAVRRAYFCLEADRGTMPVVRKALSQTSFHRKLVAYEAMWRQRVHEQRLGSPRIRVLTVTTTKMRVESLIEACSKLQSGHGLFLFTDKKILNAPLDILSHTWQTGRNGQTATLLD